MQSMLVGGARGPPTEAFTVSTSLRGSVWESRAAAPEPSGAAGAFGVAAAAGFAAAALAALRVRKRD